MDGLKKQQYNMLNVTWDFMNEPETIAITASIPRIEGAVETLGLKLGEIDDMKEKVEIPITGKRALKESLKRSLAMECASLERLVHSYANETNSIELFNNTKRKFGFFNSRRDGDLPIVAQALYTMLTAMITVTPPATNPLAASGIDAARLTAFQMQITNYSDSVSSPRNAIAQRSAENDQLNYLINNAIRFLKEQLDPLMYQFNTPDNSLYANYTSARRLIDEYTVHTQIAGIISKITDAELGTTALAQGVKVTLIGHSYITVKEGQTIQIIPEPVIMHTDEEGKYIVSTPDTNTTYAIRCTLPGYQEKIIEDIKVKRGKKTIKDILLAPIL